MRVLIFIIFFTFVSLVFCKDKKDATIQNKLNFVEKNIGKKLNSGLLEIKKEQYLLEPLYKAMQILNTKYSSKAKFFDNNRSCARIASTLGRKVLEKIVLNEKKDNQVALKIKSIKANIERALLYEKLNWPQIIYYCKQISLESKNLKTYEGYLLKKYFSMVIRRYKNLISTDKDKKFKNISDSDLHVLKLKREARYTIGKIINNLNLLPNKYRAKFFIYREKIKNCLFNHPISFIRIRTYCVWLKNKIRLYKEDKDISFFKIEKLLNSAIFKMDKFLYSIKNKKILQQLKIDKSAKAKRDVCSLIESNPGKLFRIFDIGLGNQTRIITADLGGYLERILKIIRSESKKNIYPYNWNTVYWFTIYTELKDAIEMRGMQIASKNNKFKILLKNALNSTSEYLHLLFDKHQVKI